VNPCRNISRNSIFRLILLFDEHLAIDKYLNTVIGSCDERRVSTREIELAGPPNQEIIVTDIESWATASP
jgi:hypothetical protein